MKTQIVAIAAGALCLALAAPAAASPREYSRGYYDCLAGRYDQEDDSHAYRQGCRAAQREQGRGPDDGGAGWEPGGGPGPGPGGGPGWGPGGGGGGPGWEPNGGGQPGFPPPGRPVGLPNVKGLAPAQVMAAMAAAGYRNVGTEVAGAAIYGFYFNPATGGCVQVANMNGRAIGAVPVGANPRCR